MLKTFTLNTAFGFRMKAIFQAEAKSSGKKMILWWNIKLLLTRNFFPYFIASKQLLQLTKRKLARRSLKPARRTFVHSQLLYILEEWATWFCFWWENSNLKNGKKLNHPQIIFPDWKYFLRAQPGLKCRPWVGCLPTSQPNWWDFWTTKRSSDGRGLIGGSHRTLSIRLSWCWWRYANHSLAMHLFGKNNKINFQCEKKSGKFGKLPTKFLKFLKGTKH